MDDSRRTREELQRELSALREQFGKLRAATATRSASLEDAETYRSLLETMRAFLVELDQQGRVLYASPGIEEILGYTAEEYVGRLAFDIVHEDEKADLFERFHTVMQTGQARGVIFRDRHKDGRPVWMTATGRVYRAEDGSQRIVSIVRDASDLAQARAALLESEDRFRVMAEKASDLIAEVDGAGTVLFMGANCQRLLGFAPELVVGRKLGETPISGRYHAEDVERFMAAVRSGEGSPGGHLELRYQHPDGRMRWLEASISTYHTRTGEPRAVVVTRDATERIAAERRLRQSEERYRVLSESTRDLITEQDVEGRLTYVSPACETVLGYCADELVGRAAIAMLVHADDAARAAASIRRILASDEPVFFAEPYRILHKDGSPRWVAGAGVHYRKADGSLCILSINRDVTDQIREEEERRELERRVQQAQRLESLGVLAGGVAHDFNNLLTPILGEAGLALLDLPPEAAPLRGHLIQIQRAAHRAAALTQQMLAYAGQGEISPEPVDLSALVRELGELLGSAGGRRARLSYELAEDLPQIEADATQLGQVAMNLITNAGEALGDAVGSVVVRTGTVDLPADLAGTLTGAELQPGPHVYFEVQDDGGGMDEATRARIFDPFFTTKFTGRGLGLAAALGIVRAHRGAIEIESEPGRGSRLRVLLPAVPARRPAAAEGASDAAAWRSAGTVLVVDDDEGVRAFAVAALGRCGFDVIAAASGSEALELYARRAGEIRAVLLDRTLPGSGGEEVFSAIRRIRPDARVVLMSGYAEEGAAAPFAGPVAGFLRKPFTPEALARELRRALR
ncbi:MAG TPA: PAS domain S-box protein [Myxococcota bacterium]|nr:PAS domain S-box protein [Myxococcota bacterium]